MKKINFSIVINAPRQKVWDTMLNDETYRLWTEIFSPGCYYVGNWEEGSIMKFLSTGEGGVEGGMYSRIKENRKYDYMSIEHLGFISNGVVDTTSDEVKKWTPSFENYTLKDATGGTELSVDMDIEDSHKEMFETMWPKALQAIKELAEK